MEKNRVTARLEYQETLLQISQELLELTINSRTDKLRWITQDISLIIRKLQSLSTAITSVISDSGIETEPFDLAIGTLGGSQPKSTPAEPIGSDGPSTGESSGNE